MLLTLSATLLLRSLLPSSDLSSDDPTKRLGSKDPVERVAAIQEIARDGHDKAEKLLLGVLDDRDWEVQENAARALGVRGTAAAMEPLLKRALEAPIRRIRRPAAESLAKLAPVPALEALTKELRKRQARAAAEALAVVCETAPEAEARAALAAAFAAKESFVQDLAARAAARLDAAELRGALVGWIGAGRVLAAANALESVAEHPGSLAPAVLVDDVLARPDLAVVLERRAIEALAQAVAKGSSADAAARAKPLLEAIARGKKGGETTARLVRALDRLGRVPHDAEGRPGAAILDADTMRAGLAPALTAADSTTRAAAVHALAGTGAKEIAEELTALASNDASERVRLTALRGLVANTGVAEAATQRLLEERLAKDGDVRVREECAVALGDRACADSVPALQKALDDAEWTVGTCAAVSLGKTRSEAALAPLLERARSPDWRVRASAIVGLGHLDRSEAVPALLEALGSKQPILQHTAYGFLRRLTRAEIPLRKKAWEDWWTGVADGYTFVDREEEARNQKKYGYATSTAGLYEDLDVIVLQSRGDHIELLLEKLGIEHRRTMAGNLEEAGVEPFAVFVSNCTGEVTPADAEFVQWFVRAGGYLFCSCWALTHTAELVSPGPVRKAETPGEVLDLVEARPCPGGSAYLEGVFEPLVEPQYVLYGAHLIEVLEPESVEVMIDSPACAERWRSGDLACWFRSGHGLILDSANHFDLQGLERVEGLEKADERRAWAVDHMGLPYAEMRELDRKHVFDKAKTANEELRDLSAFRFLTNFVRQKRLHDH